MIFAAPACDRWANFALTAAAHMEVRAPHDQVLGKTKREGPSG